MGSVKDLQVITKPGPDGDGFRQIRFSATVTAFLTGAKMPDHIDGKGAALCLMGAYCFEQLEAKGVKTHYRGLVNEKAKP